MSMPEKRARENIDTMLTQAGWTLQDYKAVDLSAARGIALREVPLKSGRCDYLLLVDRKPIGVVEAKKEGTTLSTVAFQSGFYAVNLPDFLAALTPGQLHFLYESTGVETFFRDERDPHSRSRQVFSFHRPETLAEWMSEPNTLRARLAKMPFAHPLATAGMRECQVEAITNLEQSFAEARPRALIQMATGSGKTFAACAFSYRLIKFAGAKRVLFLVDRANLGRQAATEFDQFVTPDDGRKFTQLYNVQRLSSNKIDGVARVAISTIQRLYSILRGEELPEDLDEKSGFELAAADQRVRDIEYNADVPIETFDFVIIDECHRSIYNVWRQVLEYFDAFLIGLTATPSKQTIGFFKKNLVMEYGHERAMADGVNVGYDVYRIRTEVTEKGGKIEKGLYVDKRSKETRSVRWERLDQDLDYAAKDLDRSVVVKDQIRTVLHTFKDALPELFPGRQLVPKTLIFAKDDSHAEDIVHICREVFGRGNHFCRKITYLAKHPVTGRPANSENLIQEFRLSPQFRIAVTVDMIATGTDVRPLECLVFLRDVRSRTYFEQMKGRGTRVLSPTDLQAVSGAEAGAKTHFIIVDAVGVCESDKTDSRPLDRKPTVPLERLLLRVAIGKRDQDTLTTLAARLARLDRALDEPQKNEIVKMSGKTLAEMSKALLSATDPDVISATAAGRPGAEAKEVLPEDHAQSQTTLIAAACAPFDKPELREALTKFKQETEQTIDVTTIDVLTSAGLDEAARDKAKRIITSFRDYIEQHKAEIEALQILYSRPFQKRLTEESLRELEAKLKPEFGPQPVPTIWSAFSQVRNSKSAIRNSQTRRFTDLVSLVRTAIEPATPLEPFEEHVRQRFVAWIEEKRTGGTSFTADQLAWLEKMRDYISASGSVDREHLEADNVLGPIYKAFGERLWPLMEELNLALAA
jgi:type I restriction enzyme, R subunit